MSSLINTSPSEQAWDAHRSELEELYVEKNKSVREIRSYMTEKYNFNASPHHYNKHLNTQWKCVKKSSSTSWKVALPYVLRINREGKEAQVMIGGKLKTPQEVCNAMVRYRKFIHDGDTVGDMPTLPSDVIVRAVVQPTTVTIAPQLPFHVMERVLTLPLRSDTNLSVQALSRNGSLNGTLRTIMPPEHSESSLMNATTRSFTSPLHRSLLYSMANNFTGLSDMPKADILRILKQDTTQGLFLALADAPKLYGVQALVRGLFRAALEAGDTETVVFILKQSPSIVNEAIGIYRPDNQSRTTPIELASAKGHLDVVRALINAGADLKCWQATEYFFENHRRSESTMSDRARIMELLLDNGLDLTTDQLERTIFQIEGDLADRLIMKHILANHQDWRHDSVLWKTFHYLNFFTCYKALQTLAGCGADLTACMGNDWPGDDGSSPTILEILSGRFDGKEFHDLLDGFPQMPVTEKVVLTVLQQSADLSVIRRTLLHGPDTSADDRYRLELLDTARRREVLVLLAVLKYLSSGRSEDLEGLRESMLVAGLTGEVEKMKNLLVTAEESFGLTGSEFLSPCAWAIPKMIEAKQPMSALTLIEAGGVQGINHPTIGGRVANLGDAIRYEQFSLIRVLLDAGADPDRGDFKLEDDSGKLHGYGSCYKGFLSIAIKEGRDEMIRNLLDVGADVSKGFPPPLSVAMRYKRLDVAQTLISHGADINGTTWEWDPTPLQCAIGTSDAGVVQFALEHGADPHDPEAINNAFQNGRDIFTTMLNEHKRRYRRGRKGWEVLVLRTCIDSNNLDTFKDLVLTYMADVHCPPGNDTHLPKSTTFAYAIEKSKETGPRFLEFLMQNKDKLNCFPNTLISRRPRKTAFLVAVETNHLPTVELLLKHGFRINEPRGIGERRTPLQQAVENGCTEIIQVLLDNGMSVNEPAAYNGGATALQLASIKGYFPIAKLLLENGAEVDAPGATINGVTALEGAAQHGRLDTVALLLGFDAADRGKDMRQLRRAIRYARKEGHVEVEQLLDGFVETGVIPEKMGFYPDLVELDD
ncbi:hypothetical protein PG991_003424 [Apiospora marii]|uniref:Clr5 domain-containing protein n=1 Tax=Apiospora marii TaxID=335849 RepID=A0ABR1S4T9_9PEZI